MKDYLRCRLEIGGSLPCLFFLLLQLLKNRPPLAGFFQRSTGSLGILQGFWGPDGIAEKFSGISRGILQGSSRLLAILSMLSKSSRDSTRIFLDGFRGILSRHFKDGGLGFSVKWITAILEGLIEVVDVIGVVRDVFFGGGRWGIL